MNCPVPYWRMRSLIRRERYESEEAEGGPGLNKFLLRILERVSSARAQRRNLFRQRQSPFSSELLNSNTNHTSSLFSCTRENYSAAITALELARSAISPYTTWHGCSVCRTGAIVQRVGCCQMAFFRFKNGQICLNSL